VQAVPLVPPPTAAVHYEVARLYAETVLLPELRPSEDPADCRAGGMFHIVQSAGSGCALAQVILARWAVRTPPGLLPDGCPIPATPQRSAE
jgi:hypothetical protein